MIINEEERHLQASSNSYGQRKEGSRSDIHSKRPSQENKIPPQISGAQAENVDIFNTQVNEENPHPMMLNFLDGKYFQAYITLLTVYALFGDDIRVMAFSKDADIGFDVINIICLISFSFEILLSVIAKPGYLNSFFFWLDLISTLSLLLDIQMFTVEVGLSGQAGTAKNTAALARAGRASRVGTKAGRVVRLVRLIRITKLYKAANEKTNKRRAQLILEERRKRKRVHPNQFEQSPETNTYMIAAQQQKQKQDEYKELLTQQIRINTNIKPPQQEQEEEDDQNKEFKESKVSKTLSDLTTKRVIVIILALLFIVPLFSLDYYYEAPLSMDYQTTILGQIFENPISTQDITTQIFNQTIAEHLKYDTPIILYTNPFSWLTNFQSDNYNNIRVEEQDISMYSVNKDLLQQYHPEWIPLTTGYYDNTKTLDIVGILNGKSREQNKALLSFLRTIFVCIVLTSASLFFSKDANDLALRPIERMIDKVKKIAQNPNIAVELKLEKDSKENNETIKIENAIIKIGMLLALGFGDAGAEIIGSNMAKGGDVDPMLPGQKKCAIYGFCDIRNFTDATEQLQEDVMLFVNNIAAIVHSMVDRYAGAANKNIGDAFLLVWKMDSQKYTMKPDGSVIWNDRKYVEQLADCALISFMKIQAKINREPKLLEYRLDQRLLKRMPGYKIKMGLGLHLGWGIEGAIGSEYKIDASYLSPNVNMASRLEAATKQYGVPMLISSALAENFSHGIRFFTRQIDHVTVKGSIEPIGFYTIDMDCDQIPPSKDPLIAYSDYTKEDMQFIIRTKKKDILSQLEDMTFDGASHIQENKDLSLIMKEFNPKFNEIFGDGFQQYLKGSWKEAKKYFAESSKLRGNDGPTKTLMDVMEEYKFEAPSDWKGYRELTEK